MKTNKLGIELIKRFEGIPDGNPKTINLDPYRDPIGILTIGWGHAIIYGERFLKDNPRDWAIAKKLYPNGITKSEAESLLIHDLNEHNRDLDVLLDNVTLNENQYSALSSFVFNVGARAFSKSTMLKLLKKGRLDLVSKEFSKWIFAGGKKSRGLINRRNAEMDLFLKRI
jgi:lysozyme